MLSCNGTGIVHVGTTVCFSCCLLMFTHWIGNQMRRFCKLAERIPFGSAIVGHFYGDIKIKGNELIHLPGYKIQIFVQWPFNMYKVTNNFSSCDYCMKYAIRYVYSYSLYTLQFDWLPPFGLAWQTSKALIRSSHCEWIQVVSVLKLIHSFMSVTLQNDSFTVAYIWSSYQATNYPHKSSTLI